ncbi:hypothetical protein [Alteromonas antoniana]|uniref:hypothetical protein n=1 Tax=Alteromonas antoniana TaxID=2803813 RepID=UPI001FEAE6A8|nr:hypothetical protein [Alteromonas antoniana]
MFAPLLIASLLSGTSFQCDAEASVLQAKYTIDVSYHGETQKTLAMNLWRDNNNVAHQYPQTQITEAWTLVRNTLIKPTRYFDGHQRAIEYQPGESIHGEVESDWPYRYQLVSETFFDQLTKVSESGSGCEVIQTFEKNTDDGIVSLSWLPALNLISSFTVSQAGIEKHWSLNSVSHDKTMIDAFFDARADYKSTDYADIGDDHTDPFLTNMVNQGFIEAGASGFYNQHGQAISGGHSH